MSHPYKHQGHINVLEVRSTLLALRWRTRAAKRIHFRFMHLIDSQVALALIAKGRSSSRVLNHVVSNIHALTLAGSMMPG